MYWAQKHFHLIETISLSLSLSLSLAHFSACGDGGTGCRFCFVMNKLRHTQCLKSGTHNVLSLSVSLTLSHTMSELRHTQCLNSGTHNVLSLSLSLSLTHAMSDPRHTQCPELRHTQGSSEHPREYPSVELGCTCPRPRSPEACSAKTCLPHLLPAHARGPACPGGTLSSSPAP